MTHWTLTMGGHLIVVTAHVRQLEEQQNLLPDLEFAYAVDQLDDLTVGAQLSARPLHVERSPSGAPAWAE